MQDNTKPALQSPAGMRTHGGLPPYGFKRREDGKRSRRGAVVDLEPVASEQRTIARVVALHSEGLSLRRIADVLAQEGLPPRRGSRWHAMMIKRLVDRGEAQNTQNKPANDDVAIASVEQSPEAPFRRVTSVFSDERGDDKTEVYWSNSATRDIVDRYTATEDEPKVPGWR